jgi:hypothetical protein
MNVGLTSWISKWLAASDDRLYSLYSDTRGRCSSHIELHHWPCSFRLCCRSFHDKSRLVFYGKIEVLPMEKCHFMFPIYVTVGNYDGCCRPNAVLVCRRLDHKWRITIGRFWSLRFVQVLIIWGGILALSGQVYGVAPISSMIVISFRFDQLFSIWSQAYFRPISSLWKNYVVSST